MIMPRFYAVTNPEISEREIRNQERSRRIAAEGMVLLENNGILPMKLEGRRIALFGNGARHTIQGGSGSGDVNTRTISTVEEGLERAGAIVTTKTWLQKYDEIVAGEKTAQMEAFKEKFSETPELAFWAMLAWREPLKFSKDPEDFMDSDDDTAVYVLARNSGEGTDRRNEPGDYQLHQEEKELLDMLCSYYRHIVVVLNVGGVIDTSFLRDKEGIDAILLMGQAGSSGGDALADVLSGKTFPGGRLTATWAEKYENYPNADTFGRVNGNIDDEYYREGIYVGYRWFDSFGIKPAYPFGYGKSYTSFRIETEEIQVKQNIVTVNVRVANNGERYSGREVVQLYVSAPEGRLEKPYQNLTAYAKTKVLAPGESQILKLSFPVSRMASYDEKQASWILEKGDYIIRTGRHSRATKVTGILRLDQETVCEKLTNVLPLDCAMDQVHSDKAKFYTYDTEEEEKAAAPVICLDGSKIEKFGLEREKTETAEEPARKHGKKNQGTEITDRSLTMDDVLSGKCSVEELADQLTIEELAELCVGTAREQNECLTNIGASSALCPGAAGDTTPALLESRNVRNMILADGPAGLRLSPSFTVDGRGSLIRQEPALGGEIMAMMFTEEKARQDIQLPKEAVTYYQYCTAIPTATLLAQTWDTESLYEAGDIVGSEMEEMGITLWLAPGMNIQRNPLCGRNFEYYSEDPLVSGMCAAAETIGVQSHPGTGVTIKHFACNNLEDNRAYNNSHVGEQALREIYFRGFETAVKASRPMAVMSSYNMINGIHAANSVDLLTTVLRGEWGFDGIVMTDWGTTAEAKPDLEGRLPVYGWSSAAGCIKAGNDLIMPGSQKDVEEILSSVGVDEGDKEYPLTRKELEECAVRILRVIAQSSAYENSVPYRAAAKEEMI